MRYRQARRSGLTLLEMVLTFAIAMLVLLALFVVMRTQYNEAEAGRDAIEDASLGRAILTRIAVDVTNNLGAVDPRFLPNTLLPNNANKNSTAGGGGGGGGGAAGGSAGGAAGGSAGAGGAASTSSATNSTSASTSSGSSSSSSITPVPFNLGIKGDAKWLILSASRVPGALLASPKAPVMDQSIVSADLRSLSYWLVPGQGLARSELTGVTADNAPTDDPSATDPSLYSVIAPEVQDILFEYFDGTTWQPSWDGGNLGGADGNTPIGPPAAIAITITLRSGPAARPGEEARTVSYKHVVALPATNALTQLNQGGQSGAPPLSGQTLLGVLQSGQAQPAANLQDGQSSPSGQSSSGGSQ